MSPISLSSLLNTLSTIYTVVGRVSDEERAWVSGFLQLELCSLPTSSLENLHLQGMVSELPISPFQAGERGSDTIFWVLFYMRVFLAESIWKHIVMCDLLCYQPPDLGGDYGASQPRTDAEVG